MPTTTFNHPTTRHLWQILPILAHMCRCIRKYGHQRRRRVNRQYPRKRRKSQKRNLTVRQRPRPKRARRIGNLPSMEQRKGQLDLCHHRRDRQVARHHHNHRRRKNLCQAFLLQEPFLLSCRQLDTLPLPHQRCMPLHKLLPLLHLQRRRPLKRILRLRRPQMRRQYCHPPQL